MSKPIVKLFLILLLALVAQTSRAEFPRTTAPSATAFTLPAPRALTTTPTTAPQTQKDHAALSPQTHNSAPSGGICGEEGCHPGGGNRGGDSGGGDDGDSDDKACFDYCSHCEGNSCDYWNPDRCDCSSLR